MNKLTIVLLLWGLCVGADAQEVPAPKPPYLALPQPGSAWSVAIAYGDQTAAKPEEEQGAGKERHSFPVRIDYQYAPNRVSKVVTSYSDGGSQQAYLFGDRMLQKYAGSSGRIAAVQSLGFFPDLFWLTSTDADYAGVEKIGERLCHRFKIKESCLRELVLPLDSRYIAWIDTESRLPVMTQVNETIYKFSAFAPDNREVVLPPEYKAAMARVLTERKALEGMRRKYSR